MTTPSLLPDDPSALASALLAEEVPRPDERGRGPAERVEAEALLADDLLGAGAGEPLSLRQVLRRGGTATIAVLAGLRVLDSLEGQAFAVLGPDIQRSLGLSDTALGAVSGLGAAIFVLAALPLGYLADRSRRVRLAALCAALAAGFTLVTGLAGAVWQLAVARFGVGIGKASTLPVHNSLLADRYPIAGRARIFAAHNLAAPLAAVTGPAAIGAVAALAGGPDGWRVAFLVLAVPLAALALGTLLLREPSRGLQEQEAILGESVGAGAEVPLSYGTAFQRLLKIRTLYYLLVGVGVLGFVLVSVPTFLNVLLEKRYGLDAFGRGLAVSLTEVGALAGVFVGGVLGDRVFRRNPPRAIVLMGAGIAVYGVVFTASLFLPGLVPVLVGVSVANFALYAATVPVYAFVAAVVPYRLRSLGFALLGIYIFLLGGFLGGIITGLLSDARGTRFALAAVTAPVCLLAAGLASYGARFVRADISLVVEEVVEEQQERRRVAAAGPEGLAVLQVRNLDVSYGPVQVLFGVDLDVHRGEVVALLGTNGAGKSTVLRAISGLVLAERGVVRLNGRSITYVSATDRVGLGVVQMPGGKALFPSMSVVDNLLAGCHPFAWDRARVRRRIGAVLELFPQLGQLADQPAGQLSGGEQQMLALAKALLAEPEVLLIDELSLGLAPVAVGQLLEVVRRLQEQGVTMLLVEQSVNVALAVADRAVFLDRGRVRFSGPAAELADRDDLLRAVFLGTEGG
ncbi:MAG: MFS transporter [Actinobacteria bacterium]|nr:MFS transporter [Actinomycetota bacterium]